MCEDCALPELRHPDIDNATINVEAQVPIVPRRLRFIELVSRSSKQPTAETNTDSDRFAGSWRVILNRNIAQ
jgi:hypothetical protein